jgi:hypothetical protein
MIADGTDSLAIGSPHYGAVANGSVMNGRVFECGVAYSGVTPITSSASVTAYALGTSPRPFTSEVSRYYVWDGNGAKRWPSGKWAETGVSSGKTPGQFDMSFSGHPSYRLILQREPWHDKGGWSDKTPWHDSMGVIP